ncbi:MAG: hypothetical protein M3178_04115 [Pseudomonadota bacterium]|nr:hypothetical protein [Pseudomonadota bacterium]
MNPLDEEAVIGIIWLAIGIGFILALWQMFTNGKMFENQLAALQNRQFGRWAAAFLLLVAMWAAPTLAILFVIRVVLRTILF